MVWYKPTRQTIDLLVKPHADDMVEMMVYTRMEAWQVNALLNRIKDEWKTKTDERRMK